MKTVEWKGITLTVVPTQTSHCAMRLKSDGWIDCHLDHENAVVCNPICPGGSNILLEGADLEKYLAAKLTGEIG